MKDREGIFASVDEKTALVLELELLERDPERARAAFSDQRQMHTLIEALAILRKQRGRGRAMPKLTANELAMVERGMDYLCRTQPSGCSAPAREALVKVREARERLRKRR